MDARLLEVWAHNGRWKRGSQRERLVNKVSHPLFSCLWWQENVLIAQFLIYDLDPAFSTTAPWLTRHPTLLFLRFLKAFLQPTTFSRSKVHSIEKENFDSQDAGGAGQGGRLVSKFSQHIAYVGIGNLLIP